MNADQLCRQVKKLLEDLVWDTEPVFRDGSVIVTAAADTDLLGQLDPPIAAVMPKTATSDPEEPTILEQQVTVRLIVTHQADGIGQSPMIGANWEGEDSSHGRGLLDLGRKIWAALGLLTADAGIAVVKRGAGAGLTSMIDEHRGVVARDYDFRAVIAADATFPRATRFSASGGGGSATLAWTPPSYRYDFRRVVLRRVSGSTAPATPASGDGVALGGSPDGATAVGVVDAPGSGTWSYSLWGVFDPHETDTDEQYSDDPATFTITV